MPLNSREQFDLFVRTLENSSFDRGSPIFGGVVEWLRNFPGDLTPVDKDRLQGSICRSFNIAPDELATEVAKATGVMVAEVPQNQVFSVDAQKIEDELWALLPKGGFFYRYADFTRHSEAPLAYHFYSSLVGVAATLNRRVAFDMGYYKLYPALGVMILGPSGLKKTSAANIMVSMLQEIEITKVYSEKLTPEALVEAMKAQAQGLIYAPEMSVFLGKQRYNEGLVPLITRLMDCPDVWTVETIGRGPTTLRDVAISSLMCSTVDWFISNTPEDTFGGGFIARNILVVQDVSPRVEAIPRPGDPKARQRLMEDLARLHEFSGEVTFSERALQRYKDWYSEQKEVGRNPEHELLATYYQRKPDHAKRVAICLHIAEHRDQVVCLECFERACRILDWTEKFLPTMLKQMFKTQMGQEQEYVLRVIQTMGGTVGHSDLVRKVQYRMSAAMMKGIISSLIEAKQVVEINDKLMHAYVLKGEPTNGGRLG